MSRGPAVPVRHRTADGLTLNLMVWPGEGPSVVLLHPNRTNARIWDFVVASSRLPNPFVAVDHRGHGDSDWPGTGYDLEDYVADDVDVIERYVGGPVVLIGAATGGNIALLLAGERPDLVTALGVVDPGLSLDPAINARVQDEIEAGYVHASREAAIADMPFSDLWTAHVRAHYGEHGYRDLPEGGVAGRYDKVAAQHTESLLEQDMWDRIDVRCPLLAVRGVRSEVFGRDKLIRLGALAPEAVLAEVVRADHRVAQDNPAALAGLIDAFVTAVTLGRPLA